MANSDYIKRNIAGPFCPVAKLSAAIGALQTTLIYVDMISSIPDPVVLNRAIMIDDEILGIVGISGSTLTLLRGCCDTIPAEHAANALIWFFDDSIGSDEIEYGGTETIGVKVLPRTAMSGNIPIIGSPPNEITFNFRFLRPYPPGNVRLNGVVFAGNYHEVSAASGLALTWTHRDRVLQADQLIDHGAASVGPEPGTTYTVQVYRADNNALLRTVTGIAGTSWTYTHAMALADITTVAGGVSIYILLKSVRNSLDSYQLYRIDAVAVIPGNLTTESSDRITTEAGDPLFGD